MIQRCIVFIIKVSFALSLPFFSTAGYAQTCECPAQNQCSTCSGNIISLNFKYVGILPALIAASDKSSVVFLKWVSPGDIFTVDASGNNFSGNEIEIFVAGQFNIRIKVNCGLEFYPGIIYGSFILLGAESKGGGTLCCTSQPVDVTAPVITGCPDDFEVIANSSCMASVNWDEPKVYDCDLQTLTHNFSSGSQFAVGTTTVTYTATDIHNNVSTCSFKILVRDKTAPVASGCPATINAVTGATCTAKVTWTPPIFTDNCSSVTVTSSHKSGDEFPLGTTNVTVTAKDNAGNTTLCKFKVIVKDQTPPVVTDCPSTINVIADALCKGKTTWKTPLFTDNCSAVTVKSSHRSGDEFPLGKTTVIYTGTDAYGNAAKCEFNVIVEDKSSPEISGCPEDIQLHTTDYKGMVASWNAVTANDCNFLKMSSTYQSGEFFPVGNTVVNYKAEDKAGNVTSCSFNVTIIFDPSDLDIAKIISPDNNGINDSWIIKNIEKYESNEVVVADRWGNVVYSANNYNNLDRVWDGSNKIGTIVPTGTYFYTISIRAGSIVTQAKGFVELIR